MFVGIFLAHQCVIRLLLIYVSELNLGIGFAVVGILLAYQVITNLVLILTPLMNLIEVYVCWILLAYQGGYIHYYIHLFVIT
jgi:hypothetical protein